jgi:hypothetical protein
MCHGADLERSFAMRDMKVSCRLRGRIRDTAAAESTWLVAGHRWMRLRASSSVVVFAV